MNKLARYIIIAAVCCIVAFFAWYFKSILIYIVVSAVVAMIGRPIVRKLSQIKIGKRGVPTWFSAFITLILILGVLISLSLLITPLVGKISSELSELSAEGLRGGQMLDKLNSFLIKMFPALTQDFQIQGVVLEKMKDVLTIGNLSGMISSVASVLADTFVAIFSICFISFFFLCKEGTFTNVIVAVLPDKYEEKIRRSSASISNLLSRYFVGIVIESLGVATINALGLLFIAKVEPSFAILIAFISGILNVVPYVGPLIGHVVAVLSGLLLYSSSMFGGPIVVFLGVILAIFLTTQLVDNYLFQPMIYSSTVKAHPLEIFIVILMGGHIGGMVGMLIAIPTYTVLRVVAGEFLPHLKFVQQITKNINKETPEEK